MKENNSLKRSLIFQSFSPLFVLVFIQHFQLSFFCLPYKLCEAFQQRNVIDKICNYTQWGDLLVSIFALGWILYAFLVYKGFEGIHCTNFRSAGEQVLMGEDKTDGGVSFLVSFVLPLLIEDINTVRGMMVFGVLLWLIIKLLTKSNLFYQNPVLLLLGYQCFSFKFVNPAKDIENPDGVYIGITKGRKIATEPSVKRKYIADDVFLIYNE